MRSKIPLIGPERLVAEGLSRDTKAKIPPIAASKVHERLQRIAACKEYLLDSFPYNLLCLVEEHQIRQRHLTWRTCVMAQTERWQHLRLRSEQSQS